MLSQIARWSSDPATGEPTVASEPDPQRASGPKVGGAHLFGATPLSAENGMSRAPRQARPIASRAVPSSVVVKPVDAALRESAADVLAEAMWAEIQKPRLSLLGDTTEEPKPK